MRSGGCILGCVVLKTVKSPVLPRLDEPFLYLDSLETGNLVNNYDSTKLSMLDYWHGGYNSEHSKVFVPARDVGMSGFRIGETTPENMSRKVINHLLAVNSFATEDERNSSYLNLTYKKVFMYFQERFFLSLAITSSSPKFVIITRNTPVYLTAFFDSESMYWVWTNEESLDERMRARYGERFYYYRMRPIHNGVFILQPLYLKKKIAEWSHQLRDKLKIMNALEVHISRRVLSPDQDM